MNSNIKIFLLCPIPEEQKPINEYIQKRHINSKTARTKWERFVLKKKNKTGHHIAFLRLRPSRESSKYLNRGLESLSFFFFFYKFCSLALLQLESSLLSISWNSRWKQIQSRFNNPRLLYEETTWYDGQIWEKVFSIIKNDRLLSTQKIQPILENGISSVSVFQSRRGKCSLYK
jgi:hypothetical protein